MDAAETEFMLDLQPSDAKISLLMVPDTLCETPFPFALGTSSGLHL